MQFSREVIELMRPYPGRQFRMKQLLQYATKAALLNAEQKAAARRAVARVLSRLTAEGHVRTTEAAHRGGSASYAWVEQLSESIARPSASEKSTV